MSKALGAKRVVWGRTIEKAIEANQRPFFFLACGICAAMLFFRRPDAFTSPQFYAEEGRNFFADAWNEGWSSCFNSLAGYFHLYPRLLANVALSLGVPVFYMPHVFTGGALLACLVVWHYTFQRLPCAAIGRFFGVLATGLVPLGNEIWMNETNVQWVLALLIPLICFGRPSMGRWTRIIDGSALVLCCLTGPYSLVLSPLVVLHAWRKHRIGGHAPWKSWPTIVVVVCGFITLAALLSFGTAQRPVPLPLPPGGFFAGAWKTLFFQLWFPALSIGILHAPAYAQAIASVVALLLIVVLYRRVGRVSKGFVRSVIIAAVLFFGTTLFAFRDSLVLISPFYAASRDFYLPAVLITWAVLCAPLKFRAWQVWSFSALFGWWIAQTILFIGPSPFVDLHWREFAASIGKQDELVVPINPSGWDMHLHRRNSEH